jgi:hypothetical protein
VSGFVDVDERGISTDARGVDASEYARDFRRAGGKKPSALRGMRPICVGCLSLGKRTQESCVHGVSDSDEGTELFSWSFFFGVVQPLGRPWVSGTGALLLEPSPYSPSNKSSAGRASGPWTGLPFTPHASTGSTTCFLICMLSLGHIRLAFRSTACSQLYLMQIPASVSCGRT